MDQNLIVSEQVLLRSRTHLSNVVFICISLLIWTVLWFDVASLALTFITNTLPSSARSESAAVAANLIITIFFAAIIFGWAVSVL